MMKSLLCVLACVSVCSAGPIVYTVNQTVGLGSVTGTITTDGNLGTLGGVDISAFNLNISDGNGTIQLVNPQSGATTFGSGLSATLTGLFFNYSLNAAFLIEGSN